jgi:hypothetical protein
MAPQTMNLPTLALSAMLPGMPGCAVLSPQHGINGYESGLRKGIIMRRLMLLVIAVGFFSSLAGCQCRSFSHGVCDCEYDNHCASRAPWLKDTPPVTSERIQPPTRLPDGTKKDL